MLGRDIRRQRRGRPIEARMLARTAEGVDLLSRLRVGYGLEQHTVSGITTIRVSPAMLAGRCIQVGSGGINAFNPTTKVVGEGMVRIWTFDRTTKKLSDSGLDLLAFNNMPGDIAGNRWGQIKIIDHAPFVDVSACVSTT